MVGGAWAGMRTVPWAVIPSTFATTCTVPVPTAATVPPDTTFSRVVSDELQRTVRPVSTLPAASYATAEKVIDAYRARSAESGTTLTRATVAAGMPRTRTIPDPDLVESTSAWMRICPWPVPVTRPVPSIVAMAVLYENQCTGRPVSTFPAESYATAVKRTVP